MNFLVVISMVFFLASCTHTIDFRTNHFASPVTGEQQWSGHLAAVGSGITKVTVVNDIESSPPVRTSVEVNKEVNVGDLMGLSKLSFDGSLSIWSGTDLFVDGSLGGFRYQFLNHGTNDHVWVGAVHGAFGQRTVATSSTRLGVESTADSKVTTSQAGVSVGYKLSAVVPYFSYIHEAHEVSTMVKNGSGSFGAFLDNGTHEYYTLGLSSHGRGLFYAFEYSMIDISWSRGERVYQNAAGAKVGLAW